MANLETLEPTGDDDNVNVKKIENKGNTILAVDNIVEMDTQQFSETFEEEINNHNSNNPSASMTWIPCREPVLRTYQEIRDRLLEYAEQTYQTYRDSRIADYAKPIGTGIAGLWLGGGGGKWVCVVSGGLIIGFVIWAETNCSGRQRCWYIRRLMEMINYCIPKEQKKMMSYIGESALASGLFAVGGWGMRVGFSTAFKNIAVGAYAINPIFGAVVYSTCWLMEWELYVGTLISPAVMPWVIYKNYYGEKRHGVILTEESLDYLKIGNDNY